MFKLGRTEFVFNYLNAVGFFFIFIVNIFIVSCFSDTAFALEDYFISISTPKPITESVNVSALGKTVILPQSLVVNSNNPNGVRVYISSKDNKKAPTKTSSSQESTPISPTTGTVANPSILGMNTFGFAVAKDPINPLSSQFSSPEIYKSTDRKILKNAKFSQIGDFNNPSEIYKNNSINQNKKIDIYYGVKINSAVEKGQYSIDILYTAIPNLSGDQNTNNPLNIQESDNKDLEIFPTKITSPSRIQEITIDTSINTNINLVEKDISIKIGDKLCTNLKILKHGTVAGNEGNSIDYNKEFLKLSCHSPFNEYGKYDIKISISKNDNIIMNAVKKGAIIYEDIIYMQSFTPEMCSAMKIHDSRYVVDSRDNEVYKMTKLKDNNCWMNNNLRLKLSKEKTLTPNDTDLDQNYTPEFNTEVNTLTKWENGSARSIYREDLYNSYGVYYTHNAATAGYSGRSIPNGTRAPNSICPKGWRLPTSSNVNKQGELWNLAKMYQNNMIEDAGEFKIPKDTQSDLYGEFASFEFSGYYFYDAAFYAQGYRGYFWSSDLYNSSIGYDIGISTDSIKPHDFSNRHYGFSVRCVLKNKYMQDFTNEDCKKILDYQNIVLMDKRDQQIYTVSKLKDGNCWMTQNLRLKLNDTMKLTPQDTDISSDWSPGSNTEVSPKDKKIWPNSVDGISRSIYRDTTYNAHGVYYNYVAATAGSSQSLVNQGEVSPHSICPKGWRIPVSGPSSGTGEYYNLVRHYIDNDDSWNTQYDGQHHLYNYPADFIFPGYYGHEGSFKNISGNGYIWSSTISSNNNAYSLSYSRNGIYPHYSYSRNYGFSVRCIKKEEQKDNENLMHMQDFDAAKCSKLSEHQSVSLTDKRDGQKYNVIKLRNGDCWMQQNLRLKLHKNKQLTPEDTDISQPWTPNYNTDILTNSTPKWGDNQSDDRSIYLENSYLSSGVYYTYSASTANGVKQQEPDLSDSSGSICPKNWRLPSIGDSLMKNDFYKMAVYYNGDSIWTTSESAQYFSGDHNLNSEYTKFSLHGLYDYSLNSITNLGNVGLWWSSTVKSDTHAYTLRTDKTSINPSNVNYKLYGMNIRCLVRL